MMSDSSEDQVTPLEVVLFVAGVIVLIVIPEVLIFGFDQEARDDWTRMIPVAVIGPIMWDMAIGSLCFGIYMLFSKELEGQAKSSPAILSFSFALIYPGVRVPYYWIKRIVFEDVPAFGYNPDNIYAVAGLNTMGLGILWAIEGALAGLLLGCIVWAVRK